MYDPLPNETLRPKVLTGLPSHSVMAIEVTR